MNKSYNEKVDVWSCGVILYLIITGFPPFYGETRKEIISLIIKGNPSFKGILCTINYRPGLEKSAKRLHKLA
jgi:serine/threonine protein kinase